MPKGIYKRIIGVNCGLSTQGFQKGRSGYWLGKKRPDISERLRKANLGKIGYWSNKKRPEMTGENNPSWINGRSYEPYTQEWTNELKEKIKSIDNYTCQLCGVNSPLDVHHIDYDKKNCQLLNLITLCRSCNSKVNFNREYYQKYFEEKIKKRFSAYYGREISQCKNNTASYRERTRETSRKDPQGYF